MSSAVTKQCIIYHNSEDCIENFFNLLPVHHKFSDSYSQLANGKILHGPLEHDTYCSRKLRNTFKDRIVLFPTQIHYQGGYGGFPRIEYESPQDCTVAFIAAHDWTLENDFIVEETNTITQQIAHHKYLQIDKYVQTIFQSFVMAFYALKNNVSPNKKLYIRIAPVAMGPSIGKHLFQITKIWYMKAVCLAMLNYIDSSWVHSVDLIDFHNIFSEIPKIPNVNIFSSQYDILDYPNTDCHYAVVAPIDSFSKPWLREPLILFDNLASCIINNTSIYKDLWSYQFKKIEI